MAAITSLAVVAAWSAVSALCIMPLDTLRAAQIAGAVWRDGRRYLPRWLTALLTVCWAIPGPFDELAALGAVAVVMAVSPQARHGITAAVYAA